MNYPSAVPSVFLERAQKSAAISKAEISFIGAILPPAQSPAMPKPLDSLYATAKALLDLHMQRAQAALQAKPPRLDLFWLHSRHCDASIQTLETFGVSSEGSEQAKLTPDPVSKTPEEKPLQ